MPSGSHDINVKLLTVLGIVIGITSVVSMVSLVEGLNRSVSDQLASLGSDVIRVRRWDLLPRGVGARDLRVHAAQQLRRSGRWRHLLHCQPFQADRL